MEELTYFCPLSAPFNSDFDVKSRVQSFTLTINTDEGKYTFKSDSNKLTSEMENMMTKMRENDIISIQDIFVRLPDGTERILDPIKLTVDGLR